jgi:hypothetical protein
LGKTDLKIKELRKFLNKQEKQDIIEELVSLTKNYSELREYFLIKIKPEYEVKILNKYKKIIKEEFVIYKGKSGLNFKLMKKALTDFKKISDNKKLIIDLQLSHVEYGVEFTNRYGDIGVPFYDNIEKTFDKALKMIIDNDLQVYFRDRCKNILAESDNIGWGFSCNMIDIFDYYYQE